MKNAPTLAPEAHKIINTTNLIVTMTSGLADAEFLSLAEFIVGPSEWFEATPRPCIAGWRSTMRESYEIEFGHLAQQLAGGYIMDMIKDQHKEASELIKEIRKYIRPLDKRSYPRAPESKIECWADEKGNFCHNVAILNKQDELISKIDPIRLRMGFPETLKFYENDKTRKSFDYIISHLDTMNSIIAMSDTSFPTQKPKDAIPRMEDKSMENLVARAFSGKSI